MLETILVAVGASCASALVSYVVGVYVGKSRKIRELHELQEEGWLLITYRGDPSKRDEADTKVLARTHGGVENDPRIQSLLFKDEELVTRSRRDGLAERHEDRRTDWAKHMKARGAESVDEDES